MKNWVQLYGGYRFDLDNVESNKNIPIEAIAHMLSNQCRWSGNTRFHFSVAQHSHMAYKRALINELSPQLCYEALMHDSPETIVLDMPRPFKLILPDYSRYLERIERHISSQFGYPFEMSPEVKEIDDRLLHTDYIQLIDVQEPKVNAFEGFYVPPYDDVTIYRWTNEFAEKQFLMDYDAASSNL